MQSEDVIYAIAIVSTTIVAGEFLSIGGWWRVVGWGCFVLVGWMLAFTVWHER